jgi:hypothetical protein
VANHLVYKLAFFKAAKEVGGMSSIRGRRLLFNRRQMLKGAGLAAGSVVVLAPRARASTGEDCEAVAGTIENVVSQDTLELRQSDGQLRTVHFIEGAEFWKDDKPTGSLHAFHKGELVVAEGQWQGDAFSGTRLEYCYLTGGGEIKGRSGNDVSIDAGTLRFTKNTQPHEGGFFKGKALDEFAPGDQIIVNCRPDDATGRFIVRQAGLWNPKGDE